METSTCGQCSSLAIQCRRVAVSSDSPSFYGEGRGGGDGRVGEWRGGEVKVGEVKVGGGKEGDKRRGDSGKEGHLTSHAYILV